MRFSLAARFFVTALLFSFFNPWAGHAQNSDNLVVTRVAALDQRSPIINIAFDQNNTKWVANEKTIFEARSADLVSALKLAPGEQSAYLFPGGNADIRWMADDMNRVLGNVLNPGNTISAAAYDAKRDELWIGTTASGLHLLKTKPTLSKVATNAGNKLSSNHILHIFIDNKGQKWVGTQEGVLIGSDTRWRLEQKYFAINRTTSGPKGDIWVAGEGQIWQIDIRERWLAVPISELISEGQVQDIALDGEGRLWIASESIVCYDPATEDVRRFGPIEYYTSQFATRISVDLDGAVWVGTEDKGVFVIDKASALNVSIVKDKELSCVEGLQDAAISVKVSGGTAPFSFRWDNERSGDQLEQLGPGTYSVTVVDARQRSKSARITIEDTRLAAQIKLQEPESAPGAGDAVALAIANGGTPQFSYRWDNGESSNIARKLSAGSHSVTITDKNGCTATATVEVASKTAPLLATVQLSAPISCHEGNNGALEVGVSGGKEPFSYTWKNRAEKTGRLSGLRAGEYEVTVTDANGATASAIFALVAPAPLTAKAGIVSVASTNNSDGAANLTVEGGSPPYKYQWDNGETGQQASKLAAGEHQVTITDTRGCNTVTSIRMTEDIQPLKASLVQTAVNNCAEAAEASLEVQVSGGKSPYSYQWNTGGSKDKLATKLKAGDYSVTITDAAGASTTSTFSVSAPNKLEVSTSLISAANTGLSDGVATAIASGGTGPYSYKWDNGENKAQASTLAPGEHRVTITDKNGCTATGKVSVSEDIVPLSINLEQRGSIACAGATTAGISIQITGGKQPYNIRWAHTEAQLSDLADIGAGDYSVEVSDASGGNARASLSIKAPPALSASISVLSAASTDNSDGIASAAARGGTPPYTFVWDNDERTQQAARLAPGERSVTVSDFKGCAVTATVSITEDIQALTASITQEQPINCSGEASGVIAVVVKGGKKPFQYQWGQAGLSGEKVDGLKAGSYTVAVRDAVGNTSKAEITLKDPAPLQANASASAPASTNGRDGRAVVQVSGGTAPYTFAWDNGETTSDADSLAPGSHSVQVTDKNGCQATATVSITENIQAMSVTLEQEASIACAGETTAALSISIKGGKGPFTIQWNKAGLAGEKIGGLAAGSYAVTVTDVLGTVQQAALVVGEPTPMTLSIGKRRGAMSATAKDGRATVSVAGGVGPYRYDWDSQETTAAAERLSPGIHTVSVTDAGGCVRTEQVEIPVRILPELTAGLLQTGQAVRMEQLQFDADSVVLKPDFYPLLDELYDFLDENPGVVVEIGGHTNSLPPDAICDQISSARAKAVADYLIARGILDKRVFFKGYGKRQPIATNTTPEGRKRNQRVEVKILQLAE
jgi:outer membrane protein OmpA-like peptidoglycan-associated protein